MKEKLLDILDKAYSENNLPGREKAISIQRLKKYEQKQKAIAKKKTIESFSDKAKIDSTYVWVKMTL